MYFFDIVRAYMHAHDVHQMVGGNAFYKRFQAGAAVAILLFQTHNI